MARKRLVASTTLPGAGSSFRASHACAMAGPGNRLDNLVVDLSAISLNPRLIYLNDCCKRHVRHGSDIDGVIYLSQSDRRYEEKTRTQRQGQNRQIKMAPHHASSNRISKMCRESKWQSVYETRPMDHQLLREALTEGPVCPAGNLRLSPLYLLSPLQC
jgi:hypothetical protein